MNDPAPETAAPTDPILGRTVGNYVVERRLGEGGMGSVYLLRHARLTNTFAALKVLIAAGHGRQRLVDRFEQEAQVAAAVGSHRVARPIDIGEFDDGIPYIVMEYVAGRSLAEELGRTGPLSVTRALEIAAAIAETMAVAHARDIVHRDLKPANVMLLDEGGVKLLDFGVARATGQLKLAHTSESTIIGTPGYISPEASTGLVIDGKTDVFSLGVLLFQMLAGALPFPAPTVQAALVNVITLPAPAVSHLRPRHLDPVPGQVERLIGQALAKQPADRPTMVELHVELVTLLKRLRTAEGKRTPAARVAAPDEPTAVAPSPLLAAETILRARAAIDDEHDTAFLEKPAKRRARIGWGIAVCCIAAILLLLRCTGGPGARSAAQVARMDAAESAATAPPPAPPAPAPDLAPPPPPDLASPLPPPVEAAPARPWPHRFTSRAKARPASTPPPSALPSEIKESSPQPAEPPPQTPAKRNKWFVPAR